MKTRTLLPVLLFFTAAATFAAEPDNGFIAHEWGTFTSVQGADGVQMQWNPHVSVELPAFVYERQRVLQKNPNVFFAEMFTKNSMVCRQRMETPVIYFYSDRARTVDVSVKIPRARLPNGIRRNPPPI